MSEAEGSKTRQRHVDAGSGQEPGDSGALGANAAAFVSNAGQFRVPVC